MLGAHRNRKLHREPKRSPADPHFRLDNSNVVIEGMTERKAIAERTGRLRVVFRGDRKKELDGSE
jgi:hypothetical protein